jgi:hypothetical protein
MFFNGVGNIQRLDLGCFGKEFAVITDKIDHHLGGDIDAIKISFIVKG